MNLQETNLEIARLTELKKSAEKKICKSFLDNLQLSDKSRVAYINETFISIEADSFKDFKNVLKNAKPYRTAHRKKHGSKEYDICSPFLFDIKNDYYGTKLKFTYYMINDLMIWCTIPICKIDSTILETYFVAFKRALTDSERHYVQCSNKKFRDLRINAYEFCSSALSWYGGDKTILDTHEYKGFLIDLKK